MAAPRVSVVTTLFNKGPFVEAAVRSVLSSSFRDLELLIVDDASTDDGLDRVRAFSDPRIRILECAVNTGRPAAANRGFDAAQGEYIAVLDADDTMEPDRIAEQVAFLDSHPSIGVVGSYARLVGTRDHLAQWPVSDEEARGLLLFEDPLLYGSCMIRRSLLDAHVIRCDEAWRWPGMDYLFLLRVARVARVATIPEALTNYRLGANNFRSGRDRTEDSARIVRAAFDLFQLDASASDVDAHLFLLRRMGRVPGSADLRAMFAWVAKLRAFNNRTASFTPAVLEQRLRTDMDHWYHVLAEQSLRNALLFLWLARTWPGTKLLYLFKVRLRRSFPAVRSGTND